MAAALGVGVDMVYRYESGRSDLSLSQLSRYAEFIGMQIGDVFPSSKPRTRELQPFLMALEEFDPEERPAVIDKSARDLAFMAMMLNGRQSRREGTTAADRILRRLSNLSPEMQEQAAKVFEVGVDKFLDAHLNGEVGSARA